MRAVIVYLQDVERKLSVLLVHELLLLFLLSVYMPY